MPDCVVCGGTEFKPHDGFYYCTECQTQSQDIRQQEMSFNASYGFLKKSSSRPKKVPRRKRDRLGEGPVWTSWQAFNFILKGMTDELIALGAPASLEKTVLQIWACYLRVSEVAFTSQSRVVDPKLSFPFRYRDGKVLFDVDTYSVYSAKSEIRKKTKVKKRKPDKKYKLRYSSRKMHLSDYESYLSDVESHDYLNQTLDSLTSTPKKSDKMKLNVPKSIHLTKKAQRQQKQSRNFIYMTREITNRQTMLTIIHLALIITHSQIQLSDLLRFIREGHLSYAITSHFLPAELKFGARDEKFINSDHESSMAAHIAQRAQLTHLSSLLKFRSLPTPDLIELLKRYASDLFLPEQLSELAVRLLHLCGIPKTIKRHGQGRPMQSFELMALAPLLVVCKLLFGLDGVTERNASHFADALNRSSGEGSVYQQFSWRQWQRALECRKAVLTVWHYPTREMLNPDVLLDPKDGLRHLKAVHKDPYRRDRVYIGNNPREMLTALDKHIENVLNKVIKTAPVNESLPIFEPSLTPGLSLLHDIISSLRTSGKADPLWMDTLVKEWGAFRIDYLINPKQFLELWRSIGGSVEQLPKDWLIKHTRRAAWLCDKLDRLSEAQQQHRVTVQIRTKREDRVKKAICRDDIQNRWRPREDTVQQRTDHNYWRLLPSEDIAHRRTPWDVKTFEEVVMPQFSSSWGWLLRQCSLMLHIHVRDIYTEVLAFEDDLIRLTGPTTIVTK